MNWKNSIYLNTVKKGPLVSSTHFNSKADIDTRSGKRSFQLLTACAFSSSLSGQLLTGVNGDEQMSVTSNSEFKKFFNQCFDKGRLKNFVLWFLLNYGEHKTVQLVEQLKNVGFDYASKAGISLGIDDLKIPPKKADLIYDAEKQTSVTVNKYLRGEITGVERFQRLIDTWHRTSEVLKQEVIDYFEATDILNPVYMMAFSGARGNISQVRQLVGMRGLMADPQGQIIDFPIRSNFREGLTLTEYIISSYGARKGIVDTALRTANAGYLTRRLVDVAQHVIISNFDCGTRRGIFLINMKEGNKTIHSLSQRTVGRILARDLYVQNSPKSNPSLTSDFTNSVGDLLARRNDEVTLDLAFEIGKNFDKVFVRSPLTCETANLICQLCYGWSLAQGNLVSIGEAVGVIAAQSIGEPGTQLTMRTFHTGGVFSGDISDQIRAPFNGFVQYISAIPGTLIRTPEGKIAFLTKSEGSFIVSEKAKNETKARSSKQNEMKGSLNETKGQTDSPQGKVSKRYKIPHFTLLYIRHGQFVSEKEVIAQISTISRKGNATDDAELTIKSDYEGQFYSKSLIFREKFIGPKMKLLGLGSSSGTNLATDLNNREEMIQKVQSEKVYEAWTWGYSWILSGKIYESKLPSVFFAQMGDFLNLKSCLSQTQWKIPLKQGNNQKIHFNIKKHNFESNIRKFFKGTMLTPAPQMKNSPTSNSIIKGPGKESIGFISKKQSILNLDIQKILYKEYGYIFELAENIQFFEKSQSKSTALNKTSEYSSGLMFKKQKNDLVFFMKNFKYSSYNLQKDSPFILQWFPENSQTLTSGFVVLEQSWRDTNKNSSNFILDVKKTDDVALKTSDADQMKGAESLIDYTGVNEAAIKQDSDNLEKNFNWKKEQENHTLYTNFIIHMSSSILSNGSFSLETKNQSNQAQPLFKNVLSKTDEYSKISWFKSIFFKLQSNISVNKFNQKQFSSRPSAFQKNKTASPICKTMYMSVDTMMPLSLFVQTNRQGSYKYTHLTPELKTSQNLSGFEYQFDKLSKEKENTRIFIKMNSNLFSIMNQNSKEISNTIFVKTNKLKDKSNLLNSIDSSQIKKTTWFKKSQVSKGQFDLFCKTFVFLKSSTSKNKKQPLDILFESFSKPVQFHGNLNKQVACDLLSSDYLKTEFNKYSLIKNKTKFNALIEAGFTSSQLLNPKKMKPAFSNSIISLQMAHYLTKTKNIFLNKTYVDYLKTTNTNRGVNNLVVPFGSSGPVRVFGGPGPTNGKSVIVGNMKPGWLVIPTTNFELDKTKLQTQFASVHQTYIKPGKQIISKLNLDFVAPVFVESVFVSNLFNVNNVMSFNHLNENSNDNSNNKSLEHISLNNGKRYDISKLTWIKNKKCRYGVNLPNLSDFNSATKNGKNKNVHFDISETSDNNKASESSSEKGPNTSTNNYYNSTEHMGLLIQPVHEHSLNNKLTLKQYTYEKTGSIFHNDIKTISFNSSNPSPPFVSTHTSTITNSNSSNLLSQAKMTTDKKFFFNFNKKMSRKNQKRDFNKRYLVNQSFNTLYYWKNNQISLFNKQNKTLLKMTNYPTQDFSLLLNSDLMKGGLLNSFPYYSPMSFGSVTNYASSLLMNPEANDETNQVSDIVGTSLRITKQKPFNFNSFILTSLPDSNKFFERSENVLNDLSKDMRLTGPNTLNNFALKYQIYSFAHHPFLGFDAHFYPSLSKSILSMLSFYLNKTNMLKGFELPVSSNLLSGSNSLSKEFKNSKLSHKLNYVVSNLFEQPYFSLNIHERLNLNLLNSNNQTMPNNSGYKTKYKTVLTKYLYNIHNEFSSSQTIAKTNYLSPFNGEIVYTRHTQLIDSNLNINKSSTSHSSSKLLSVYANEQLPMNPVDYSCMFLTKNDLISYYLPTQNFQQMINIVFNEANQKKYTIKDTFVKLINMSLPDPNETQRWVLDNSQDPTDSQGTPETANVDSDMTKLNAIKISKLNAGTPLPSNLSLLGDFFVYGDPISNTTAIQHSGQIIHYNNQKITLRRAQPIFISPKGILRKFDGDFIDPKAPVITLSYQRLKTGDIIQGIPKVEQFFEARTTKRGRLFRDSLPSLLKALFKRYLAKLPLDLAVRQSFYKIQQIVVDGVQRVYKSQGVTIADKHLEVIVKQMTSKVRILDGAQTGFFPGEVVDLCFVEKINSFLIKKITYEPLVLGITKASLEVDSFLSAASFQQTTRVLSKAAIYRKKDFLKGLKENVILGNLIPAGTGYLVYLDDVTTNS